MKKFIFIFLFLIAHCTLNIENCMSQLPPRYYWRVIPSPVQTNLNCIISTNNGLYIFGDNGTQLYSTDNGNSFQSLSGLPNLNFYSISNYINGRYTIVGQNGAIYYHQGSLPGTWSQEVSGTTSTLVSISSIHDTSSIFYRYAVGAGGIILKSTWILGTWSSWLPVYSGTTQDLNYIFTSQDNGNRIGWITGNNGTLLKTTNCGINWNIKFTGVTNKLNCIRFYDSSSGWIMGSNGLIMKTINGGNNWTILTSGTTAELKSIMKSSSESYLYGNKYFVLGSTGIVLQSTDIGTSWTVSPTYTQNNFNSDLYMGSYSSVLPIIVGNSGTILIRAYDSSYYYKKLESNNIRSFFSCWGTFDEDTRTPNTPGFEWPKGTGKTAIFSSGLTTAAYYQGQLREAAVSYKGEYVPGFCNNEIAITNDTFKLYSVKRGDGAATNTDWLNWGLMVPYGAPFVDVNNNGIYDPQVDTPGVKGASQTIYLCMTDGFSDSHNSLEGFGGGTAPLYSEVHLTAWCYSQLSYADMQFLKFVIINKGTQPWTKTYFSLVSDPDLGYPNDDYIGCDTVRKLGFCYNANNNDPMYGAAPPAVGLLLLKGPNNKYTNPPKQLDLTSFDLFSNSDKVPPCEEAPNPDPMGAYYFMQGYKRDSTCWLDPTQLITQPNFYKKTKFLWPGDPETNIGWTEYKGEVQNCGHDSSGTPVIPYPPGDMLLLMNSGTENLTVMPGDTQTIVLCQLIAKGTSNLNSVTKLKQLADFAREFYNSGYTIGIKNLSSEVPTKFNLEQNYPNPFNPTTKIKFDIPSHLSFPNASIGNPFVSLKIYDVLGREIQTLVNEKLNPGSYEVTFDGSNLSSGIYFYQLKTDNYVENKKMVLIK